MQQRLSQAPQLLQEYGQLRALDADILLEHGCEVAEGPKAAGRNRYCDVLPFDYNRCVGALRRLQQLRLITSLKWGSQVTHMLEW